MRVLIVSSLFPAPVISGGARRIGNLIREIGRRHSLQMLSLITAEQEGVEPHLDGLEAPAELVLGKVNHTLMEQLSDAFGPSQWFRTARRTIERLQGTPRVVRRAYFPEFERRLRQVLNHQEFDVVQLEFAEMGRYLPLVRRLAPRARVVLEEIEITYIAYERAVGSASGMNDDDLKAELARMKGFQHRLWPRCDALVAMSEVDREHIRQQGVEEDRIWVVPNGVDTDFFSFQEPGEDSRRLLFLGYFMHPPNVTGLRFFAEEIWPIVRREQPRARIDVVGDAAPPEFKALDGRDGITVHGFVPDLLSLMRNCRAMVVPILHGGGTRLKVLEAFSAGLPVVSTPIGCEGIDVRDGEDVLLAERAGDFARQVCRVLDDTSRARSIALGARDLVERKYSWQAIGDRLEEVWACGHTD